MHWENISGVGEMTAPMTNVKKYNKTLLFCQKFGRHYAHFGEQDDSQPAVRK